MEINDEAVQTNDEYVVNDKPQDDIVENEAVSNENVAIIPFVSSMINEDELQNKRNITNDVFTPEIVNRVIDDDINMTNMINDRHSESHVMKANESQRMDGESILRDSEVVENDKHRRKPKNYRNLSEIFKELAGPFDKESAVNARREPHSETEDD